jgi:uncharacterized protein (TIGR02145 family)
MKNTMLKYTLAIFAVALGHTSSAQMMGGLMIPSTPSFESQYPVGSVFCSNPTVIADVTNPITGRTWMDRNLGASQAATSSTDANAYGDLYQWGRGADGHQCRTSPTTGTLSSTDQPGHGDFILPPNSPNDWRIPQNTNLWQGVNGVNNPCPSGYRLPTETELNAELASWSTNDASGAFASPLKLPMPGDRGIDGLLRDVGDFGGYWCSAVSSADSRFLFIFSEFAGMSDSQRATGLSVRCIKEIEASLGVLNCGSAITNGKVIEGEELSGVTTTISYTGGNGGYYPTQSVSSSGVSGLTATLAPGLLANGSGSLVYTITGTPSAVGMASFDFNIGGQSCSLNLSVVAEGTITSLNCNGAILNGVLLEGVAVENGVGVEVIYNGASGGAVTGQTFSSSGVTGLTATPAEQVFAEEGDGVPLFIAITGTPATAGTASFVLNIGGQSCDLNLSVGASGSIAVLNCGSATNSGTLTAGIAVSGVSSSISYTGGDGGPHNGQTVTSTGLTGLTATLSVGTFANGSGTLIYAITGTPSAAGTASFALNIGGQTCTLTRTVVTPPPSYPAGSVFCASGPTAIVEVTNPTTGKTWMDRNLGAAQVATSSNDANSYGDLYQWGRRADGHQCRNSATTSTNSSSDQPGHGNFILEPNSPYDWRSPQNTNLWQGVNGVNNPCPSGYRLPTETEINAERLSWSQNNSAGALASPLRLPMAGGRSSNGSLDVGTNGYYWSSTVSSTGSRNLEFDEDDDDVDTRERADGFSVRCIKELVASLGALNCSSATTTGTIIEGQSLSGVSSSVPYTGGNGGYYAAQSVSSSGVSGLTATLAAGLLANGSGSLVYTITGTPAAAGIASFALNIGGQSCTLNFTVDDVTSHSCGITDVHNPSLSFGTMTDQDGNIYRTILIGSQEWMAENLKTSVYRNGNPILNLPVNDEWSTTEGAWAHYDNDANYECPYGKLYNWYAVEDSRNICPLGWHVPTLSEFDLLIAHLDPAYSPGLLSGSSTIAGGKMKSTVLWNAPNTAATNESGFSGIPGGARSSTGTFGNIGNIGRWWSSSSVDVNSAWNLRLQFDDSRVSRVANNIKSTGQSVRCVKD